MDTIIVPVDGASNIKLEVLDFDTLATVFSRSAVTPVTEAEGLKYNCTGEECSWFDREIQGLPETMHQAKVIAPVSRGASGGLVGRDNTLIEVPGRSLTLAYTQEYPEQVEEVFRKLAGGAEEFFLETGSVRDLPGSLTLMKRFLFEETMRLEVLARAECFGTLGVLLSGHFLGEDYLGAVRIAGNEHTYWMCHTGARDINHTAGTPASLCTRIESFGGLVPEKPHLVYEPLGRMPRKQASGLGLARAPVVIAGGHDTCLSHIPVMSTFYQAFPHRAGAPVIHLEAGTWTMAVRIGGPAHLPEDGYQRDILVQGTVDGHPVVVARYGGGNDFKHLRELALKRGIQFGKEPDEILLAEILSAADCFVLPNISPVNRLTGPFPHVQGKIINEPAFFRSGQRAFLVANLSSAITTSVQLGHIAGKDRVPVILTAGGSRDRYFRRLIATLAPGEVYAMFDSHGRAISETTALGAAIVGKAACLDTHPYRVDLSSLGISYRRVEPFSDQISRELDHYRDRFIREVKKADRA